jgi:hypothetical protein
VKRNRGRRNRERLERRFRQDLKRQKKINNQQPQINALRDALKVHKEQFLSTASDAAAAIELTENEKAFAVAVLDKETKANKGTIFQSFRGYLPGKGKWENIDNKLFQMKYVNHLLILGVKHIRDEVYTKERLADRVPGFILRCVEGLRSIQNRKKGSQKMIWSSGSINRIHHAVEIETQSIIPMTLIDEIHDGEAVDGI